MQGVVTFRGTWRWSLGFCRDAIIGGTVVIAISVLLVLLATGRPLSLMWDILVAYSGPMLGGTLFIFVLLLLLGWLLPVKATRDGIVAAVNGWGRKGVVKWADIRGVTADYSRGITMLKLRHGDSSTAYLALPLDNYADLAAYAEKHAGAENPLTRWLKTAKPDA